MHLDAHEQPPSYLRAIFKRYKNRRPEDLEGDADVLDLAGLPACEQLLPLEWQAPHVLNDAFATFMGGSARQEQNESRQAFLCTQLPNLLIVPNVIPLDVQREMLDKIFHRDLSDPVHHTNVNLHHRIAYPAVDVSFFQHDPADKAIILPNDPETHRPMTVGQFLARKLRWITLGGQYDWTNKVYPAQQPPAFPMDMSRLLREIFPDTAPEAAIVNLYSPGDTLSMHRDVSEQCDSGLISISIGCDALFVIGMNPAGADTSGSHAIIRLRSGDAVYMDGAARFAWHGVPCIIPDSCAAALKDWPSPVSGATNAYEQWRGWLSTKRINLNVRQIFDSTRSVAQSG